MELKVKLNIFEGPLDLLLYLIQKNEMDILEIRITEITEQYLKAIDAMREFNIDVASDFMYMAATLIRMKARSILPRHETEAEAEEEEMTREDLIRQLIEHRKYKEAASQFKQMPLLGDVVFKRPPGTEVFEKGEEKLKEVSITELSLAFQDIIKRAGKSIQIVKKDLISVAEKIKKLKPILVKDSQVEFTQLFKPEDYNRGEIVVTFIAILELAKLQKIRIMQHTVFGTIYLLTIGSLDEVDYSKLDDSRQESA